MAISRNKRRLMALVFVLLFLILAPIIVFYANGDIMDKSFEFLKTGGIFLRGIENGSTVFINNKQEEVTGFLQRDLFIKNLRPNTYHVKVIKENLNDWEGQITIEPNLVSDLRVLSLPKNILLEEIPKTIKTSPTSSSTIEKANSDYSDILKIFNPLEATTSIKTKIVATTTYPLGSENNPKTKKKIGVWYSGKDLFLSWLGTIDSSPKFFCKEEICVKKVKVFSFDSDIKDVDLFFGENEILTVSTDNKIYAIEAQENPLKKPQMIYEGKNPKFIFVDESVMYIKDNDKLFRYAI